MRTAGRSVKIMRETEWLFLQRLTGTLQQKYVTSQVVDTLQSQEMREKSHRLYLNVVNRNNITGQIATYLPWQETQPAGGATENHVAIHVESKLWKDTHKDNEYCSACDLNETLVFTLMCVCKHTYFDKKLMY